MIMTMKILHNYINKYMTVTPTNFEAVDLMHAIKDITLCTSIFQPF